MEMAREKQAEEVPYDNTYLVCPLRDDTVEAIRAVPKGYLDDGFSCPFLEMQGGQADPYGKVDEAYSYFTSALGILSSFVKGQSKTTLVPTDELMSIDSEAGGSCKVCSHPEVETINKLLRQGKSLRDIESEFGVSRSGLSRHKGHIG